MDAREQARLDALLQLNLLDTPPSESFDRITRMAAKIFALPIAAVSLTDRDRQWFKSRVGVEHWSIPRERAPCAEVAETTQTVLIPDLLDDPCYAKSILARNGTRFYAGAPLVTRDGYGLGALCVLGTEPRQATEAELASLRDLAAMVMAQIELQHAFGRIDPTSGLSNRVQLREDLEDLGRDHAGEHRLAVLVDLTRSEQLNSGLRVLGTRYLDEMVKQGAALLRAAAGHGQKIYHVAPTQFAFVAPAGVTDRDLLATLEERIAAGTTEANARLVASLSVGLVPFTAGSSTVEDIVRSAYGAALDARTDKVRASVYSSSSDWLHKRQFRLLNDIEQAIEDEAQLRLALQPRMDVASGRCVGAEGLIRWRHPELGEIAPGEFIPLVEHSAHCRRLTDWVIRKGIGELAAWQREGVDIQLSLNIIAANLDEPDFAQRVLLYLLKHQVRPERLELELTESAAIANTRQSLEQLRTLAEAGIRIAIDDFGTGYSSLAYLQSLPAQVIKIDQSFVRNIVSDSRSAALAEQMIALGSCLGYRVVAEGVEDEPTLDLLARIGCDEAQGFLFSPALEPREFLRWLSTAGQDRTRMAPDRPEATCQPAFAGSRQSA